MFNVIYPAELSSSYNLFFHRSGNVGGDMVRREHGQSFTKIEVGIKIGAEYFEKARKLQTKVGNAEDAQVYFTHIYSIIPFIASSIKKEMLDTVLKDTFKTSHGYLGYQENTHDYVFKGMEDAIKHALEMAEKSSFYVPLSYLKDGAFLYFSFGNNHYNNLFKAHFIPFTKDIEEEVEKKFVKYLQNTKKDESKIKADFEAIIDQKVWTEKLIESFQKYSNRILKFNTEHTPMIKDASTVNFIVEGIYFPLFTTNICLGSSVSRNLDGYWFNKLDVKMTPIWKVSKENIKDEIAHVDILNPGVTTYRIGLSAGIKNKLIIPGNCTFYNVFDNDQEENKKAGLTLDVISNRISLFRVSTGENYEEAPWEEGYAGSLIYSSIYTKPEVAKALISCFIFTDLTKEFEFRDQFFTASFSNFTTAKDADFFKALYFDYIKEAMSLMGVRMKENGMYNPYTSYSLDNHFRLGIMSLFDHFFINNVVMMANAQRPSHLTSFADLEKLFDQYDIVEVLVSFLMDELSAQGHQVENTMCRYDSGKVFVGAVLRTAR